jgi:uncharacterized membrane protein
VVLPAVEVVFDVVLGMSVIVMLLAVDLGIPVVALVGVLVGWAVVTLAVDGIAVVAFDEEVVPLFSISSISCPRIKASFETHGFVFRSSGSPN